MHSPNKNDQQPQSRIKRQFVITVCVITLTLLLASSAFKNDVGLVLPSSAPLSRNDSLMSINAFRKVYTVLMSPRCMNCHPAGDAPLQGNDSHVHLQGVKRGQDGKGLYAMKCSGCHQDHNLPGLHMPPGNPKWRLPPADMKMVFEGRSQKELARQLLDKRQNGGKSIRALLDHITSDTLVLAGWHPADGLIPPPMSHKDFVRAFREWIKHGAVAPDAHNK